MTLKERLSNLNVGASQIARGLRALDSVIHCDDQMTPEQAAHDRKMRETPPKDWTIADIAAACETSRILSLPRNNPKD